MASLFVVRHVGTGQLREDISENLKTIRAIPLTIPYSDSLKIRVKAYMSKETLEKLNKRRVQNGEELFANPRNAAAGSLRQLDSKVTSKRELSYVFVMLCLVLNN